MSFQIFKVTPKTLKYTSDYTHYLLDEAIDLKYIFINKLYEDYWLHYNPNDEDSSGNTFTDSSHISTVTTEKTQGTDIGVLLELGNTLGMRRIAVSSSSSESTIDSNVEFYLIKENDETTFSTTNQPTSLVVQKTFPNNKSFALLNGSFVTYTPAIKQRIIAGFDFLPQDTLGILDGYIKNTVIVVPERDETGVSPYQDIGYACNWEGNELNFKYATSYKQSGYKGQISLREI